MYLKAPIIELSTNHIDLTANSMPKFILKNLPLRLSHLFQNAEISLYIYIFKAGICIIMLPFFDNTQISFANCNNKELW